MTASARGRKRGNSDSCVFDLICSEPGITRAEIAAGSGFSVTAVGHSVDRLIDEGLISAQPGTSRGGRPAEALFPSANSVVLVDLRGRSARVFLLDLKGAVLFFDERTYGSTAERTDSVRDLIGRSADALKGKDGDLFAVAFVTESSVSADPDTLLYAKARLSPRISKSFVLDRISAEATLSKVPFDGGGVFCSVSRYGVKVSYCRKQSGKVRLGGFSPLTSSYGTGFGRVFSVCRDEKEAGKELAGALLNSVAILSPDVIVIEISDCVFDEKLGDHIKKSLSVKLPRVPGIKTFFRDEERLRLLVLSRLKRSPFEKEGRRK